jgi:hypothetical protein
VYILLWRALAFLRARYGRAQEGGERDATR